MAWCPLHLPELKGNKNSFSSGVGSVGNQYYNPFKFWSTQESLQSKVLWGNPAVKSVLTGNATAEVCFTVLIPIATWLGLLVAGEQPSSSLLFQWPSYLPGSYGINAELVLCFQP